MNEENKRRAIILTFIGALTLLFLVVGGTFAFFQIVNTEEGETSSTLTGETEGLTKYGTPTLNQGTNSLHINLKASDMGYSKRGTPYWASNVEENDYETDKQQHIISTAKISGAESEDTELSCTSELTIKGKITEMVDDESKEVSVNPLVEEDGYVYLGSKNGGSNKVEINPTQIDLKQIIDKSMGEGVGYQTEVSYTIKGNTSIDIIVDIDIINRDANQNSLAGKSINFTITNKNISCSVKEPKGKVYMTKLDFTNKEHIQNIYFGNYNESNFDSENIIETVDLSDTEKGTPEGSITLWYVKNGKQVQEYDAVDGIYTPIDAYDVYIGSNSNIYATDLSNAFYRLYNVETITFDNIDTSEVTDMNNMFNVANVMESNLKEIREINNINTSSVTNMSYMFSNCTELVSLDLSGFDTSKVTDMSGMFSSLYDSFSVSFPFQNWSHFNTSLVTNMSYMFYGYSEKSLDLSTFDTSSVTDMSYMFGGLITADLPFKEWKNFVTSNVKNMSYMFEGYSGNSLDLSTFDTSSVTDMSYMFIDCNNLITLDLSSFNFDKVNNVVNTFDLVPETCEVKIKRSQQETFERLFSPYDFKLTTVE